MHAGVAMLFVGVAASSAFQEAVLVRAAAGGGGAGRPASTVRYVRPTSELVAAPTGGWSGSTSGADLRVRRGDEPARPLTTYKSYFPSHRSRRSAPCRASSRASRRREVGLQAGVRRDLWTAVAPDIRRAARAHRRGRPRLRARGASLPAEQRSAFLGQALAGLARSYAQDPPPATFRIIASPMVSWIWIGALIVFAGGLIALWPAGAAARRPATAAGLARVARELRGA